MTRHKEDPTEAIGGAKEDRDADYRRDDDEGKAVSLVEAALAYTQSGLFVFPAPRGAKKSLKSAAYSNGSRWGATRDANEIRYDFARWPNANIGIVTGPESGIFVVEADTKAGHGVDGIAALAKLGPLPPTRQAQSPSGSLHHYFRYPVGGFVVRNSASRLAPGVDVRGQGGMVIAPPSVRDDGAYRWLNTLPVANAPTWLLQLVVERPRPPRTATATATVADAEYLLIALSKIDPDIDEGSWFQIACALRAELGNERGFEAWDQWSAGGEKYKTHEMQKRWEYLSAKEYRYSARTIYHFAEQADPGWADRLDRENKAALDQAAAEFIAASDEERDELIRRWS